MTSGGLNARAEFNCAFVLMQYYGCLRRARRLERRRGLGF